MLEYIVSITPIAIILIFLPFIPVRAKPSSELFCRNHTIISGGVAIICVLLSHIGNYCGIRYAAPLGGSAVACFLIISGYGLSSSFEKSGLKHFFIKRVLRIWIPYMIIRIIMVSTSILLPMSSPLSSFRIKSVKDLFLDIILIKPLNPNGWYITCVFFWYIVFYIIHRISFLEKKSIIVYITIGLVILVFGNELWAEQAFSFFIGVCLYKMEHSTVEKRRTFFFKLFGVGSSILYIIVFLFFFIAKQMLRNIIQISCFTNGLQLVYKVSLAFLILNIALWLVGNQTSKPLQWMSKGFLIIGLVSYELYLSHGYFLNMLKQRQIISIALFYTCTIFLTCIVYVTGHKLSDKLRKIIIDRRKV